MRQNIIKQINLITFISIIQTFCDKQYAFFLRLHHLWLQQHFGSSASLVRSLQHSDILVCSHCDCKQSSPQQAPMNNKMNIINTVWFISEDQIMWCVLTFSKASLTLVVVLINSFVNMLT